MPATQRKNMNYNATNTTTTSSSWVVEEDNGGVMSIGSHVENPLLTLTASSSLLRSSQDDYDESDIDNKNNNDSGDDDNEDHRKMELEVLSSSSLPLFRLTIKNSWGGAAAETNTTLLFVLLQPKLFWKKIVLVFIASYALLPLILYKSKLPASIYAIILILIHVGVLIIYCYKVQFNQLDFDRISFGSRILALFVTIWLLTVVSNWQDHTHIGIFALQMLVLCLVHSFVLALLMVAVQREAVQVEEETDDDTEHLTTNTDDTQMLC